MGSSSKVHLFPDRFAGSAKWFHLPGQRASFGLGPIGPVRRLRSPDRLAIIAAKSASILQQHADMFERF
jgi:hypothetical protein